MTNNDWMNKAVLYEILSLGFRYPSPILVHTLVSGEYAAALLEVGEANGLDSAVLNSAIAELSCYLNQDVEKTTHSLRADYTGLFVGAPEPYASPYAGIWWAKAQGVQPLLFVNTRSIDIKRFMNKCGIDQAEGRNEPLDHIAAIFEFLHYLAAALDGVIELPEDAQITTESIDEFSRRYLMDWVNDFAASTVEYSRQPFYKSLAQLLIAHFDNIPAC